MDAKKIKPLTLVLSLCVVMITYYPLCRLFHIMLPYYASLGVSLLVQITVIAALVHLIEKDWAAIGLSRDLLAHGLLRGMLWAFCFGLMALLGYVLMTWWGMHPLGMIYTRLPDRLSECLVYFCVGGLIAPVAEEVFFRGVLFGFLRPRGLVFALVVSTLIFVAVHLPSGIPVTQTVGGVVFALSYDKERSLLTPIIIHSSANMSIFGLSLLMKTHMIPFS